MARAIARSCAALSGAAADGLQGKMLLGVAVAHGGEPARGASAAACYSADDAASAGISVVWVD